MIGGDRKKSGEWLSGEWEGVGCCQENGVKKMRLGRFALYGSRVDDILDRELSDILLSLHWVKSLSEKAFLTAKFAEYAEGMILRDFFHAETGRRGELQFCGDEGWRGGMWLGGEMRWRRRFRVWSGAKAKRHGGPL